MTVTIATLADQILSEINREGDDYFQAAKRAIVTAIKYMEVEFPHYFEKTGTITILSGEKAVDLPADFARLVDAKASASGVYYGAIQGFLQIPYPDLNNYYNTTSQSGLPLKYSLFGGQFVVFPYTASDTDILLSYNYKDAFYPSADGDTSIWFNDETIDPVRYKALEVISRDFLRSPDSTAVYAQAFADFVDMLIRKSNQQSINNLLSI